MDALRELDQSTARIDAARAARTRAKNRVIPDDQTSLEDMANAEIEHAEKSEVVKNTSHPSQSALPKRQVVTSKKRPVTDASRMGQNEMATAVTHGLCATLGFDPKSCGWHGRDADIWRPIPDTRARTAAEQAIEKLKPAFAAGYLSGVLKFLESRLSLPEWESDRNLLPMHNGVLNLATGELNDYGARVFNWQVPHKHDAAATCPTVTRWLHTVTNGDNDLKTFLLAWMRVVLTGGAHLHKYVEIVGPGGTGKSTFIRLCQLLVGNGKSRPIGATGSRPNGASGRGGFTSFGRGCFSDFSGISQTPRKRVFSAGGSACGAELSTAARQTRSQ